MTIQPAPDYLNENWTRFEAIAVLCSIVEKYARYMGDGGDAEAIRMARAVLLGAVGDSFASRQIEDLQNENERLRRLLAEYEAAPPPRRRRGSTA